MKGKLLILDIERPSERDNFYPIIIDHINSYNKGDNVYMSNQKRIILDVSGIIKTIDVFKILALPTTFTEEYRTKIKDGHIQHNDEVEFELSNNSLGVPTLTFLRKYYPNHDPSVHNGFWTDTANLMEIYKREGNEERYQGIVDCRILFGRYNFEQKITK